MQIKVRPAVRLLKTDLCGYYDGWERAGPAPRVVGDRQTGQATTLRVSMLRRVSYGSISHSITYYAGAFPPIPAPPPKPRDQSTRSRRAPAVSTWPAPKTEVSRSSRARIASKASVA